MGNRRRNNSLCSQGMVCAASRCRIASCKGNLEFDAKVKQFSNSDGNSRGEDSLAKSGLRLRRISHVAWDRRAGCHEGGPSVSGRGGWCPSHEGLAAYFIINTLVCARTHAAPPSDPGAIGLGPSATAIRQRIGALLANRRFRSPRGIFLETEIGQRPTALSISPIVNSSSSD
jgi:hypothetical protein